MVSFPSLLLCSSDDDAQAFTLGSIVWVVNGFAGFLPFCDSHFQKADHSTGWTAFLGATIFEFGSIFGMWEAWNRSDAANFGWGVSRTLNGDAERGGKVEDVHGEVGTQVGEEATPERPTRQWKWFSAEPHYWHEVGFLAAFAQWCAATIFWISGFVYISQTLSCS